MIDVNLTGVWNTAQAAIPHLIARRRGGSIILTSSTAGLNGIAERSAHYVAAKHGVVGLMRTLALELAPHSIRVNTVHPTGVDTPMIVNDVDLQAVPARPARPDPGGLRRRVARMNALPVPWVEAVDITNAILLLASDEARYVTGVTLPVDAGFTNKK